MEPSINFLTAYTLVYPFKNSNKILIFVFVRFPLIQNRYLVFLLSDMKNRVSNLYGVKN